MSGVQLPCVDCSWIRHLHAGYLSSPAQPYEANVIGWDCNTNIGITDTFGTERLRAVPQRVVHIILHNCTLAVVPTNIVVDKHWTDYHVFHSQRISLE